MLYKRIGTGPEPPRHYEVRFLRKGGRESVWVELHASRARFLGRPAVLGVIRDTTVRRAVEQEVRNSEKRLAAALAGAGAVFRLYFPAADCGVDAAPSASSATVPAPRSERLLYVDDEDALVFPGTRILRRMGYDVTGHTDPQEAAREFDAAPERYDAVITDLAMPGMSGFEFARLVLARRPTMPVVLMSGYVKPEDQAEAARFGVREIILKPNTVDELGAVLDRVLRATRRG